MNSSPFGDASNVGIRHSFGVLEFGAFRLVPRRRELLRNGAVVRIGARAFDLLTALASRAGDIVCHAELIARAWPNRVVSDCNLKVQIAALQKVLGPDPSGDRHIRSVPLRGYVFVTDVRFVAGTQIAPPDEPSDADASTAPLFGEAVS